MTAKRMNRWHSKKIFFIAMMLLILIALRVALPYFVLKKTNQFLAEFSPVYSLHIDKLKLHLIRCAYSFHGITAILKEEDKKFMDIDTVDVSLAWREIFKGRLVTDVEARDLRFQLFKNIKRLSPPKKEERTKVKEKLFPIRIERVDLHDGQLIFEDYEALDEKERFTINDINGRITNLNPNKKNQLSYFNLTANIVDPEAPLKVAGALKLNSTPLIWDLDAEWRNFHLKYLNPYFKKHIPLTFTSGTLDLYSEMQSKEGVIHGYAKPFIRQLDVIANKEKFKNAKHFGFEIISAIANLILREKKTKSVATKLDFTIDKKLKINSKKGFSKALEHKLDQQLSPGIEDQFQLK